MLQDDRIPPQSVKKKKNELLPETAFEPDHKKLHAFSKCSVLCQHSAAFSTWPFSLPCLSALRASFSPQSNSDYPRKKKKVELDLYILFSFFFNKHFKKNQQTFNLLPN